ncbi:hypothetical protein DXG03_000576 [Asterophora parasitica]|uniref:protein-tyrosine-phosphatase n=1 Tax=Asterophora parasitica TaxID=117018 RepID=A0A9P7G3P2_9AGAR|nr:hypothetical protein DXG03_000576 [Asterophora parasitica]
MDISPAPAPKARPRAFTSAARLFGNDLSNGDLSNGLTPSSVAANGSTGFKKTQRAALPTEWFMTVRVPEPPLQEPLDDAMDVDTQSFSADQQSAAVYALSPTPASAAPTITGFTHIFFDASPQLKKRSSLSSEALRSFEVDSPSALEPSPSQSKLERNSLLSKPTLQVLGAPNLHPNGVAPPRRAFSALIPQSNFLEGLSEFSPTPASAAPTVTGFTNLFFDTSPELKKRRSLSSEALRSFEVDSPSPLEPSPSQSKLERISKPTIQGLGAPSSSFPKKPRRPALSAMLSPSDAVPQSAYPIQDTLHVAPPRRAFSALIPQSNFLEGLSADSSSSFDMNDSPAQAYSKRQQGKTLRRCDGTEDFRRAATTTTMSPSSSRLMTATGLPGFGDNEALGKILPCHRVREDGLMRINSHTLNDLLDGKYSSQIVDFHVIDCRFDYEYAGGHIPGAVNINTTSGVEELLLGPSLTKPRPSTSGDSVTKTLLVFHCEFSAKRAPTL